MSVVLFVRRNLTIKASHKLYISDTFQINAVLLDFLYNVKNNCNFNSKKTVNWLTESSRTICGT